MIRQTVTLAQPNFPFPAGVAHNAAVCLFRGSARRHPSPSPRPGSSAQSTRDPDRQTTLPWLDRALAGLGIYVYLRPLVVGLVHGMAGSAAIALLVLATIRNPRWALTYLLLFGTVEFSGSRRQGSGPGVDNEACVVYRGERFGCCRRNMCGRLQNTFTQEPRPLPPATFPCCRCQTRWRP